MSHSIWCPLNSEVEVAKVGEERCRGSCAQASAGGFLLRMRTPAARSALCAAERRWAQAVLPSTGLESSIREGEVKPKELHLPGGARGTPQPSALGASPHTQGSGEPRP